MEKHSANRKGIILMKTCIGNKDKVGLTWVEVLVVLVVLGILILLVFPMARVSNSANRITCVNSLKQVSLSFRLYAGDNNEKYPMNISTNIEPLVLEATPVYKYFQSLSNELGTPKVVACPSDAKRNYAKDFSSLNDRNISYFVGLDANQTLTNAILAGDRNIENGVKPVDGMLRLTKKQNVRFTKEIHIKQGDIALVDGSVRQVSSALLRSEIIRNSPFTTNRIKLP